MKREVLNQAFALKTPALLIPGNARIGMIARWSNRLYGHCTVISQDAHNFQNFTFRRPFRRKEHPEVRL